MPVAEPLTVDAQDSAGTRCGGGIAPRLESAQDLPAGPFLDLDHMANTIMAIAQGAATIVSGQATPTRVDVSQVR